MPTFSAVSPKGGAGKTTTMINFGLQLANQGAQVALLDADPNGPLKKLAARGKLPASLVIIPDVNEDNISDVIRDAARKYPFVLVDLEGTAAKIVVNALQQTDYVIIPMRGSYLDADEAGKAIKLVTDQELAVQRHVPNYRLPYSILITCTQPAYETRITKGLREDLAAAGLPMLDVELCERDAFKAIFKYKCPLEQLDPALVPGIPQAIENAKALTAELVALVAKTQENAA